jgi:chemotaxis protein histidine kinase CheA
VPSTQLGERMEEIRRRFASKLGAKLQETDAALPLLTRGSSDAVEAVAFAYRRFHEICGTGRTLGFSQVGQAAGEAESILFEPFQARRALTDHEVDALRQALCVLRSVADVELQSHRAAHG